MPDIKELNGNSIRPLNLGEIQPIGIIEINDHFRIPNAGNNRIIQLDDQGNTVKEYTGVQRPMHLTYKKIITNKPVTNFIVAQKALF